MYGDNGEGGEVVSREASEFQYKAMSLGYRGKGLPDAVSRVETTGDPSFWNRFAGVYDLATRSGNDGLDEAAAYVAGFLGEHDVVLDAACGTGAFACAIAPHVGFVAACDFAPKMVARARKKMARLGLANAACAVGDICRLDFADDSFDVAIAGNVLHLLDDPEAALAELVRVVRTEGVIAIPNYVNAESQDRRFLKLIGAAGFSPKHEWDERGFLAFLEEGGVRVVEHRSFDAKQPLCVAICRAK